MLSASTYKIVHMLGIMMLFLSIGMLSVAAGGSSNNGWRKRATILHGIALLLLLLGGFGMIAKLPTVSFQNGWVWGKVLIWIVFGGLPMVIKRNPAFIRVAWYVVLVLGFLAALLALTKPF